MAVVKSAKCQSSSVIQYTYLSFVQESKPLPAPEKKSSKGENLKKSDKKKAVSKVTAADSAVLDDPVAEKLRQQR